MGLITSTQVKSFLKIPSAVTTDDTLITDIISRIEDQFKVTMDLEIEEATFTEYYDGDGTNKLILKQIPVSGIVTLHDSADRTYGATDLIDASDYVLKAKEGIIELDGLAFSKGLQNIKVVYVAGWASGSIPDDIQKACICLASADYIESQGGINAIEGQDFIYKPEKLRKEAQKIIDSRRKIR